jgi:hypothetical protein
MDRMFLRVVVVRVHPVILSSCPLLAPMFLSCIPVCGLPKISSGMPSPRIRCWAKAWRSLERTVGTLGHQHVDVAYHTINREKEGGH